MKTLLFSLPFLFLALCASLYAAEEKESFDSFPLAAFTTLQTACGQMEASEETAAIESIHSRSAPNVLRIKGGTNKTLELSLNPSAKARYFSVYAERYTTGGTLNFRVYSVNADNVATEVLNADTLAISNNCGHRLTFYIPKDCARLRFVVSSQAGLLMDDMAIQELPNYEGFDILPLGAVTNAPCLYGTLSAAAGHIETNTTHALSAPHCLRLLGGANKTFLLTLHSPLEKAQMLLFSAERWTSTNPFTFRVYARTSDGSETEIINGDNVALGALNTSLSALLPAGTAAIRWESTTPANSGVLMDNLVIGEFPEPEIFSDQYPVMIRLEKNPVARLSLWGQEPTDTLDNVILDLTGTDDLNDIESISLYLGTNAITPSLSTLVATSTTLSQEVVLTPTNPLMGTGLKNFWVSIKLKNNANLDHKLRFKVTSFSRNGVVKELHQAAPFVQRIGYALFVAGLDKAKNVFPASFRIPGLARTKNGTLVAVIDIRYNSGADLPSNIDVGVSRSTDNGVTWSPLQIIMDYGEISGNNDGIGDPSILVDEVSGTIWVSALGKRGIANSSPGGVNDDTTGQFCLVSSSDDGVTWSALRTISPEVKKPEWKVFFQGPGHGITKKDGTLVFPAQYWDGAGVMYSTLVYSKDRGVSWQRAGAGAWARTSECIVAELADGSLMLNCRNEARSGARIITTTTDLGNTWTAHPTNNNKITGLVEPGACQGSLLAIENTARIERALFFSNPDQAWAPREKMTLKVSLDEGNTWKDNKKILYDVRGSAGYSDIAPMDDEHIGILYEAYPNSLNAFFLKIPYDEILPVFHLRESALRAEKEAQENLPLPVVAETSYSVSSDTPWITLITPEGGSTPQSFSISANTSTETRTGTIQVQTTGLKPLLYTIEQAGEAPPTSNYESWAQDNFPAGATESIGPHESYSKDNIPNLVKYALGLDPKKIQESIGTQSLIEEADNKKYFSWTFPLNPLATDVLYKIESITSTQKWSEASSETLSPATGATSYTFKHSQALETSTPAKFFRLVIEKKAP